MEADEQRGAETGAGRGGTLFESRRVLAPRSSRPAVIFMALVVGVPFVLAIYLSFTDATAARSPATGSASTTSRRLARPELPPRAPEHVHLHARLAGDRRPRRRGPLHFLVRDVPRQVVPALPGPAAVGGAGRALDDRLALDLRLALQRRQLDARGSTWTASSGLRRVTSRDAQSAAVARPTRTSRSRRSRSCTPGGSSRSRS